MIKNCNKNKILNPKTNRCVLKTGKMGKLLLINNCKNIFIKWSNNSCYIDSLLVALFNKKSKKIEELIFKSEINNHGFDKLNIIGLKIREELLKIYKIITNQLILTSKYNCTDLRGLLEKYYTFLIKKNIIGSIIDKNDNWLYSQLDIYDFFELLLQIFKINDKTLKIRDGNNIIYSNLKSLIPSDFIYNKSELKIKDIYPKYIQKYKLDKKNAYIDKNGVRQSYFIKKYEILKGDILFISIYRNTGGITKNDIKIIPCDLMKLKENTFNLHLSSILIHYGSKTNNGHYITLYKCNDMWYEYNDLEKNILFIGKLRNIIKNSEYTKNIIGLIYTK
jgi:hypothetical protein